MKRLKPDERRDQILAAAYELASREGYLNITRDGVADAAGVAAGLVNRYFFHSAELRRCIMIEAIAKENLRIIAEGLAVRDVTALTAEPNLKMKAIASIGE